MNAPLRHTCTQMLRGLLASPLLLGCSFQDFDYLTQGRGDLDAGEDAGGDAGEDAGGNAGGDGPEEAAAADAPADGSVASEAAADASPDVDVKDATVHDGPSPSDAASEADAAVPEASTVDGSTALGPNLLVNASFEQGYVGWTFVPQSAMGKYAFEQMPVPGSYTIDGQYELATWSGTDSFTVQISQTFTTLPDGTYTFKGNFNCGVNNQAYVFAKGCGGPDQQQNIGVTSPTSWLEVGIASVQVTGGEDFQVGFLVDASPTDWLNADAFTFAAVAGSSPNEGGTETEAGTASDGGTE